MPSKNKRSSYRLLWEISGGSRLLLLAAFLTMTAVILCNYMLPQIVRFVVDSVVGSEPVPDTWPLPLLVEWAGGVEVIAGHMVRVALLILAVAALGGLCNFLHRRCLAMGSEGMIKRLRDRLYTHIQHQPYQWHVKVQTGDIIQRCTSDVEVVRGFIANQLLEMVRTILLVVFAYSILFPMNPSMAFASIAYLPIIFVYSFVYLKMVSDRFLAADEAEGQLLSIAQENFTGVRVVRAFGRERHEVDRFDRQNHHFSNLWIRLGRLLSYYWGLGDLITGLQMITICLVGTYQAVQGNVTAGEFMVFLTYNSMTIWPVRGLGRILSEGSKTGVSLARLQDILDSPVEESPPDAAKAPITGDIAFEHVTFAYEDMEVLRDVSFTVERGTTLGILGGTGSGKTTVAHLLCRLYDLEEEEGRITLGGRDIRDYDRAWVRQNVGIVLQEPFLFSRTIRENIASLSPDVQEDEVREAARIACVDEAITQFGGGYDTVVGERGVTLSGGQKQRVAIARTILKNPPIMIFDDSLSAVDTETDLRIREALGRRTRDVTTVIIAHRITSLSRADKIIVLEEGRILEMGTPAELLERGGVYRRIHDMQQSVEDMEQEVENP